MRKQRAICILVLLSAFIVITIPMPGVKAQETFLGWFDVPSDGTSVTGPVLQAGREYRFVAYGIFWSSPPPYWYTADAQYYTNDNWATYAQPDGHSFLQINNQDVYWGPFSGNVANPYWHTYTIYIIWTDSESVTFRTVDWIDGNYDNNECHLRVGIYEGPIVPPMGETAWAYGGDYFHCFKEYGINNWGWTNGPLGPNGYEFDIYAGAGKCDITKGTVVGTLTINYDGSTATIAYNLNDPWVMDYAQLYVGSDPLPMTDKGKYTASPGSFPYSGYFPEGATTAEFTVPDLSGPIYVAAHADVFEA